MAAAACRARARNPGSVLAGCASAGPGSLFDVSGTRRTPSELPIAIDMDKTAIANIQQSLQLLNRLGDYTARLVGLELALQLNENLIGTL
jgi:hypothetical protein